MQREGNVLLLLAALGIGALWIRDREPVPEAPAAPNAAVIDAEVGRTDATTSPTAEPAPAATPDKSTQLELPDGSLVPALNGAVDAPPLARFWGAQVAWSPIVARERNDRGVEWYRHENGSYSTTQMVFRTDLGRYDAMTRVAHPGPADVPGAAAVAK